MTADRDALLALAAGECIAYSQDGDCAWLYPSRIALSDEVVGSLRRAGHIAPEPYDEDQHARFGPPDVITEAGRSAARALAEAPAGETGR